MDVKLMIFETKSKNNIPETFIGGSVNLKWAIHVSPECNRE